jgi:hypothetical protein
MQFEGYEITEFEDFITRMQEEPEYLGDVRNLFIWLELIGETEGAKEKFFRHEGFISDVMALPPNYYVMKDEDLQVKDLRLYCQRLNEHVVILFNGGIKTKQKAQDCPNVSAYFRQANLLAKKINHLFNEGEISWNIDYTDIIFGEELILEL